MSETDKMVQPFGYTEMYEWVRVPKEKFGMFVQFSKRYPNRIEPFHDSKDGILCGVSSICSVIESDNPKQWKYAYMCNSVGDVYVQKETLAVGIKVYDQEKEMSYITTKPWSHHVQIPNPHFVKDRKYLPRTSRSEWVRVTFLGKAIVKDDGSCVAGQFCTPSDNGLATTATSTSKYKFYVLERLTKESVMIQLSPISTLVDDKKIYNVKEGKKDEK